MRVVRKFNPIYSKQCFPFLLSLLFPTPGQDSSSLPACCTGIWGARLSFPLSFLIHSALLRSSPPLSLSLSVSHAISLTRSFPLIFSPCPFACPSLMPSFFLIHTPQYSFSCVLLSDSLLVHLLCDSIFPCPHFLKSIYLSVCYLPISLKLFRHESSSR